MDVGIEDERSFREAVEGLAAGDFSRLAPLFGDREPAPDGRSRIEEWFLAGRFERQPVALAQALTCACMLGRTKVARSGACRAA